MISGKRVFAFSDKKSFLRHIQNKKTILVAINAEKLEKKDIRLTRIINNNIGYPDGIGAVWALRKKGLNSIKIAGAEFWLDIINKYYTTKTFYLLGACQEIIEKTEQKLKVEFPGIRIIGFRNGFLKDGDIANVLGELKQLKPDIVFVAMGSPKQEFLMEDFLKNYPALYMGLGGSFDVYSGEKRRAPKVFIDLGLEWLYRLLREPSRIGRQINLIKFFFKVIFGRI